MDRLTNIINSSAQDIATYSYDALNRLKTLTNIYSPAPNTHYYTYDNVGNRLTKTTPSGVETYTYDNIYQLTQASYPDVTTRTYNYDEVGNRTTTSNATTTTYTTNNLNQYTQVGGAAYTYDANGNLTSDATNSYTYDSENRLTSSLRGAEGDEAIYTYDPFGRRTSSSLRGAAGDEAISYIYDGDQVILETTPTTTTKYIYGPGIDEPISMQRAGETYYYHFDGLGSVTALTNSTGETVETYTYDAYGQPNTPSTIGNPYMFTARRYDTETGLYYYRARYYDPEIGRFLQTDPIGYQDGINLYTYVGNNPINWIDPFGLDKQKKEKPWWEKLEEGYYYGTAFGQEALDIYAGKWSETGNPLWAVPGTFASLWTPETYQRTGWTLVGAKSFVYHSKPLHIGFDLPGKLNIIHFGKDPRFGRLGYHIGVLFKKAMEALWHINI